MATEMKWAVERHDREDGSIAYEVWQSGAQHRFVVSINDAVSKFARQDTRLIAAAPDMLVALKGLLATHKPGRGQCCAAADAAIDAIARATGASS